MGNRGGKQTDEKVKKAAEEKKIEDTLENKVEQLNNEKKPENEKQPENETQPQNETKPTEGCKCNDCSCDPCSCGVKQEKCDKCNSDVCNCKIEDTVNEVTKEIGNLKVENERDEPVTHELENKLKEVGENEVPSLQPESVVEIKAL